MTFFPTPLHPAVVHFPVAFVLLGTIGAIAALFIRQGHLAVFTAGLFALALVTAVIAHQSGERTHHELVMSRTGHAVLAAHEHWAERTLIVTAFVAVFAAGTAFRSRPPILARGMSLITAIGALAATACVFATGHFGGKLVYEHGAGVTLVSSGGSPALAHESRAQP
jgi:uncharacterized membrane protein